MSTQRARLLELCFLLTLPGFLGACSSSPLDAPPLEIGLEGMRAPAFTPESPEVPVVWMEPQATQLDVEDGTQPGMESFSARNADIRDVLVSLFEGSSLNLVVASDVRGTVTFDFKATSQEEALLTLLDLLGLSMRRQGDFVVVEGRQTKAFQLDYVSGVGDFGSQTSGSSGSSSGDNNNSSGSGSGSTESVDPWENLQVELQALLGDETDVVLKPEAGSVVITGSSDTLRLAESYLADLEESLHRQVVIEAEVLEVTVDDEQRLGVAYSVFPGALPSDEQGLLRGGAAILTDLLTGGNAFQFGLIKSERYGVIVDALKKTGQVRVLSRPRVATLNNQPATITVAEQVPVIERNIIDGETTRTEFDIRFEEAGVNLNLLPQISEEGDIVTRISPRITEVVGQVTTPDGFQVEPILSVRQTNSTLRIRDGQSVVIGGLRFSRQTEVVDKVPLLGDIPFLGLPFRRTIQTQRQVELIIVLTPHTLDDRRQREGLQKARAYYEEIKRPFHLGLFFDNPPDGRLMDSFLSGDLETRLNPAASPGDRNEFGVEIDQSPEPPSLSRRGLAFALMRRAIEAFEAGNFRQAELRIEQAERYGDLGGWTKLYRASLLRRQGRLAAAERCLEELQRANPEHVLVANNLAALKIARGCWSEAKRLLEDAVQAHPEDRTLKCNLAAVLYEVGNTQAAIANLQEVLQAEPRHPEAQRALESLVGAAMSIPVEPVR